MDKMIFKYLDYFMIIICIIAMIVQFDIWKLIALIWVINANMRLYW